MSHFEWAEQQIAKDWTDKMFKSGGCFGQNLNAAYSIRL